MRPVPGGLRVLAFSGAREWRNRQTRTVQVRVPERAWGFNSPLAHNNHDGVIRSLISETESARV